MIYRLSNIRYLCSFQGMAPINVQLLKCLLWEAYVKLFSVGFK